MKKMLSRIPHFVLMILTKLKDKEKIITQPKRKKDERAEVAH
jgi:hypothetical protein